MASRRPTITPSSLVYLFFFFFFFFFFFILFFFSSFTSASRPVRWGSDKVRLDLYYESLCPYSAGFIVNYLAELFEDDGDLLSIVDLHLSPWGNAMIRGNDTFVCQHGPAECLLNTVEACAIDAWPKLKEHFTFIYCVESLVYERKYSQWESCYEKLDLDSKPVSNCLKSGYGKELELKYAGETNALQPPHEYVPWVVVDGQPLYEDYENFVSYICEAYKGAAAPKACSKSSHYDIESHNTRPTGPLRNMDPVISPSTEQVRSLISSWVQQITSIASFLLDLSAAAVIQ